MSGTRRRRRRSGRDALAPRPPSPLSAELGARDLFGRGEADAGRGMVCPGHSVARPQRGGGCLGGSVRSFPMRPEITHRFGRGRTIREARYNLGGWRGGGVVRPGNPARSHRPRRGAVTSLSGHVPIQSRPYPVTSLSGHVPIRSRPYPVTSLSSHVPIRSITLTQTGRRPHLGSVFDHYMGNGQKF